MGPILPRILSGTLPVANLPLGRAATRPLPLDRPMVETAFDRLYGGADALSVAYREGRAARAKLMTDLQRDMAEADAGPLRHRDSLTTLTGWLISYAAIRRSGSRFCSGRMGHAVSQGAAPGTARRAPRAARRGLSGFAKALGPEYQDTVVLVISEFGRT